jgi:hypothetical protein
MRIDPEFQGWKSIGCLYSNIPNYDVLWILLDSLSHSIFCQDTIYPTWQLSSTVDCGGW